MLVLATGLLGLFLPPGSPAEAHLVARVHAGHQGFDRCGSMSSTQMSNFWNNTAYYIVGVYLGGETAKAAGCFLPNANWISSVSAKGWGFLFIWDGLQAPCTTNTHRMSSDPADARAQGEIAMVNTHFALNNIGQDELPAVAYLDIENYNPNNSSCRAAVNAYITGWADVGLALQIRPGLYSSSSGGVAGYLRDNPVPLVTDIWFANWDGRNTVWGDPYFSNTNWSQHQRVHQFRGPHSHTFNGSTLTVDDDCIVGNAAGGAGGESDWFTHSALIHTNCVGNGNTHNFV